MRDHKTKQLLAELNVYQRALKDLNTAFLQREKKIRDMDEMIKVCIRDKALNRLDIEGLEDELAKCKQVIDN